MLKRVTILIILINSLQLWSQNSSENSNFLPSPQFIQSFQKESGDDFDGDGIPNSRDECKYQPGRDKRKYKGCPEKLKSDSDGDGVLDYLDMCPKDKGKSFHDGCPDIDEDGIKDIYEPKECVGVKPGSGNVIKVAPQYAGINLKGCADSDRDMVPDHLEKDGCVGQSVTGFKLLLNGEGIGEGSNQIPESYRKEIESADPNTYPQNPTNPAILPHFETARDNKFRISDNFNDYLQTYGLSSNDGCYLKDDDGDFVYSIKNKEGTEYLLKEDNCMDSKGALLTSINNTNASGCGQDGDKDNIPDEKDLCPDEPGKIFVNFTFNSEFKGCKDEDGDGVPDAIDKCLGEKGVDFSEAEEEFHEYNGCKDVDGDYVPDQLEQKSCLKQGLQIIIDERNELKRLTDFFGFPEVEVRVKGELLNNKDFILSRKVIDKSGCLIIEEGNTWSDAFGKLCRNLILENAIPSAMNDIERVLTQYRSEGRKISDDAIQFFINFKNGRIYELKNDTVRAEISLLEGRLKQILSYTMEDVVNWDKECPKYVKKANSQGIIQDPLKEEVPRKSYQCERKPHRVMTISRSRKFWSHKRSVRSFCRMPMNCKPKKGVDEKTFDKFVADSGIISATCSNHICQNHNFATSDLLDQCIKDERTAARFYLDDGTSKSIYSYIAEESCEILGPQNKLNHILFGDDGYVCEVKDCSGLTQTCLPKHNLEDKAGNCQDLFAEGDLTDICHDPNPPEEDEDKEEVQIPQAPQLNKAIGNQ